MIILNPGSSLNFLDYGDYIGPAAVVGTINNNPVVLS